TTTGSTSGGIGVLPANVIFYSEFLSPTVTEVRRINPDASGDTLFISLSDLYGPVAPNPVVAGQYVFAYRPTSIANYKIYKGNSLDAGSAVNLVSSEVYEYVSSLQVTPDGSQVVFTAVRPTLTIRLCKVAIAGSANATVLDANESSMASISPLGDKVVYSRVDGGDGDIYIRGLGATDDATALTNNTSEELWPQISRDGTQVVFSSDRTTPGQYDLYTILAAGGTTIQVTNTSDRSELGASWSPDSTTLSFASIRLSGATESGLFKISKSGSGLTLLKSSSAVGETTYWTGTNGKAPGRVDIARLYGRRPRR
ncbi:MAG: TolB family protein, partial [Fimbriimonas sp.]